jgi:hypothetical protein
MEQFKIPSDAQAIGYKKLIELFGIQAIPHFCSSYSSSQCEKVEFHHIENLIIYLHPASASLPDDVFKHLEFALKYEGLNLYILKKVLQKLSLSTIMEYLSKNIPKKKARILWYLYEEFNKTQLPLSHLKNIKLVPLLNSNVYYCRKKPMHSLRHGIANNLLGTLDFSPFVRKTARLDKYEKIPFRSVIQNLAQDYSPFLLQRAVRYVYTKETLPLVAKKPEPSEKAKLTKFFEMLHKVDSIGPLTEQTLLKLRKEILEKRVFTKSYRESQLYIRERKVQGTLCYISPPPKDVPIFMQTLINTFEAMQESKIHPIVTTAVLSFGFIYIHPFEDGNGRVHRLLIHYSLTHQGFVDKGSVLPFSISLLQDQDTYDNALNLFSKPLLELITNYSLDKHGKIEVFQEITDFYRFIDFTPLVEYLFESIYKAISSEFKQELFLLSKYDQKRWNLHSATVFNPYLRK